MFPSTLSQTSLPRRSHFGPQKTTPRLPSGLGARTFFPAEGWSIPPISGGPTRRTNMDPSAEGGSTPCKIQRQTVHMPPAQLLYHNTPRVFRPPSPRRRTWRTRLRETRAPDQKRSWPYPEPTDASSRSRCQQRWTTGPSSHKTEGCPSCLWADDRLQRLRRAPLQRPTRSPSR